MDQVHKRFTSEQVKVLLKGYCQGILERSAIEETLGIGKSRFFVLLREYRHSPDGFSIAYERSTSARLPAFTEEKTEKKLMLDKSLIDDSSLTITTYNYSAIRDCLAKHDTKVALSTIIERPKRLGYY